MGDMVKLELSEGYLFSVKTCFSILAPLLFQVEAVLSFYGSTEWCL